MIAERVCSSCDTVPLDAVNVTLEGGRVVEVVRCALCDVRRCGDTSCRAPAPNPCTRCPSCDRNLP